MVDGRHVEKYIFGYNSTMVCPICRKFLYEHANSVHKKGWTQKCRIMIIQHHDGRICTETLLTQMLQSIAGSDEGLSAQPIGAIYLFNFRLMCRTAADEGSLVPRR